MDFINIIINQALALFWVFDSTFNKEIPTAGVEVKNLEWGFHPSYWDDEDLNAGAPLVTKTITYRLMCDPKDHEAIVEAIAGEFAKISQLKLFSLEVTRPSTTKWVARKDQAMTSQGITTLTITWSEDSRLFH